MPDDKGLKQICDTLTQSIRSKWSTYQGHTVRADAGDAGMIYVALRGAKRELEAAEKLSGELESLIESELADEPAEIDFAISVGSSNKDLLLQIELRYI